MRSTSVDLVQRVNGALTLLRRRHTGAEATAVLAKEYGVSPRQAARYVREAKQARRKLPLPERKVVFTVKLPLSLAHAFRHLARTTGESLSALVTQALAMFLKFKRHG